jgi:hypothetical protein
LTPSLDFSSPNYELSFKLFLFGLDQLAFLQNDAMQAKSQFDLSSSWTFVEKLWDQFKALDQ